MTKNGEQMFGNTNDNFKMQNDNVKLKILILLFSSGLMATLFIFPIRTLAAPSGSENYQMIDRLDYGGGQMDSQNYSLSGSLLDAGDTDYGSMTGIVSNNPQEPVVEPTKLSTSANGSVAKLLGTMTEIKNSLSEIGQINISKDLTINSATADLNVPIIATVASLTAAISTIPILLNASLLFPFANLWASLLSFLGFGRRRKKWGVVYDSETRRPIPLAVVQIFEEEFNKLFETQVTDQEGRFSFLVKAGKYYIKVTKKNYIFPSKIDIASYAGNGFVVSESKVINLNIPLDPEIETLARRISVLTVFQKYFNIFRTPFLMIGTVISFWSLIVSYNNLSLALMLVYVIVWLTELYKYQQSRSTGIIFEESTHKPLDLAIIRLFSKDDKLIATRASDLKGRFQFLVGSGNYHATAIRDKYLPYNSQELEFKKATNINLSIPLKNKP